MTRCLYQLFRTLLEAISTCTRGVQNRDGARSPVGLIPHYSKGGRGQVSHRKPISPPLNPMESGQYRHDNNDSRLRQQREPHRIWHRKRHDDIHVGLPQLPLQRPPHSTMTTPATGRGSTMALRTDTSLSWAGFHYFLSLVSQKRLA